MFAASQPICGTKRRYTSIRDARQHYRASSEPSGVCAVGIRRAATTDSNGNFAFLGLVPGSYQVKLNAPGVAQAAPVSVTVAASERGTVTVLATRIPEEKTTIQVIATPTQVAQAQVKQQEKQRIVDILPNYYTSYIWTAAPMTQKLKFNLALRSIADPVTFLVAAGVAGVEQAHNTFPGYGRGWEGYGKRYGSTYADTVAGKMLGSAIFPVIFHQDPRYFYRGSGSIRSRINYALISTVTCRGDNGRLEFNYSRVLGNFAAAGLSNVYRAPGDRRATLTLRNGLIITASGAVVNLLREFVSRKLTSNVPSFANGKP
ncbi:MAG: carboxypeptidase-like regulatory domain-containing protein [Terriglobia bacterium]